jgi:hypothetical protein
VLALPGTGERQHHGHPGLRVGNRILVTLWPDEARGVVKLSLPDQTARVAKDPEACTLVAWPHHGWTNVHRPAVTRASFAAVVRCAWGNVAPQTPVADARGRRGLR